LRRVGAAHPSHRKRRQLTQCAEDHFQIAVQKGHVDSILSWLPSSLTSLLVPAPGCSPRRDGAAELPALEELARHIEKKLLKGDVRSPSQKRRIGRSRGEGNSPAPRPINRAAAGAFAYRHREAERGTDCPRRGAPDACVKDRDPQGRDLKTRRAPRVEPDRHGRGDTIRRNRARYRCQSSPSRARSSLQKRQRIPSPCAGCKQRVRHQGPCRRPTRGPISLRRIVLHAANLASCEPSKEQAGAPDLIGRRLIV
jgi:hypothetical protein